MGLKDVAYSLDAVLWAKEALDFSPDGWQADLLRSPERRILLNCCRQSGKSTTAAILALHTALFRPGSLILMVSPSLRQSLELFRKLSDFADQLTPSPARSEDNKLSAVFENKSRVVALPGHESTIRGYSAPSLVVEDEASRCEDEIYTAIRPMLAVSSGRLILMSTPRGCRGHFYKEWSEGGPTWKRVSITADQVSRISPDFLEQERASLGDWMYQQEYFGKFVQSEDQYFSNYTINKMFDSNIKPLWESASI